MSEDRDDIALVRQAQQGQPGARGDLLRLVEPRLTQYVGRLTLDRDLTTDLVQESIAEMLKIFDTLKDPERFWCWLYTITLNKVRMHYRQRWRRRETSLAAVHEEWVQARSRDVVAELVTQELKEIVVRALGQLEPRQRAVLTLRCYEQMSYQQIGAALGCSPLGARALFFRAKKTMTGLLRAHGIDKAALPVALLIFGKFSATSKAAAAGVSISAATLDVGLWGTLAGLVTPTVATILLAATLAGTGGALVIRAGSDRGTANLPIGISAHAAQESGVPGTCWYYYPPGSAPAQRGFAQAEPGGAETVLIRTRDRAVAYSQWLQKEQANYYRRGNTIEIRNYRQFAADFSVRRLPTDSSALRAFLKAQDGHDFTLEPVAPSARGLLVAVEPAPAGRPQQAALNYDVSMEDYFRHDWALNAAVVDRRDDQHRAGWTYFSISGHFGSQPVSGYGQLPLVAAAVADHGPSLSLTVGEDWRLLDSGAAAEVRKSSGAVLARYPGGSLFQGLGRPWTGLHTIDTIRRDAARAGIAFTTRPLPDGQHVEIVLHGPQVELTYGVHLYEDWIETIVFCRDHVVIGEWTFSYPKPDEAGSSEFRLQAGKISPTRVNAELQTGKPRSRSQASGPKGLWLLCLAEGTLVQGE